MDRHRVAWVRGGIRDNTFSFLEKLILLEVFDLRRHVANVQHSDIGVGSPPNFMLPPYQADRTGRPVSIRFSPQAWSPPCRGITEDLGRSHAQRPSSLVDSGRGFSRAADMRTSGPAQAIILLPMVVSLLI